MTWFSLVAALSLWLKLCSVSTALYFGSFNPPHKGHEGILQELHSRYAFDEICLVLSPQNPMKGKSDLSEEIRLDMVRHWTDSLPFVHCSDIEFEMERPSYTYLTLRRFREKFPETPFAVVMGMDSFVQLHRWRNYEEIVRNHKFYVYPREGYSLSAEEVPVLREFPRTEVVWMDAPLFPYASSLIRQALQQGKDVSDQVPEAVWTYIKKHSLYQKS